MIRKTKKSKPGDRYEVPICTYQTRLKNHADAVLEALDDCAVYFCLENRT